MKLGIVGAGTIVKEVLPRLGEWGWEVQALCGTPTNIMNTRVLAQNNHVPDVYSDYTEMLKDKDLGTIYIAVPNFLHYDFSRLAMEAGKHVIVEKPMTSNYRETVELAQIAKARKLCLFEAISTLYLPNFMLTKKLLPRIGPIRIISCNCSQYSRRYDAFRAGEVLPVFDPQKSGGALMDLNLYNLHWITGLFGTPDSLIYQANVERGIDTSGILTLQYAHFYAVSIAAKDCTAPMRFVIQGSDGYLLQESSANTCTEIIIHLNDGTEEHYNENPTSRLEPEFRAFACMIGNNDLQGCSEKLEQSILVSKLQTQARLQAGIQFPADVKQSMGQNT